MRTLISRKVSWASLALAAGLSFPLSCASTAATLTAVLQAEPTTLDPHLSSQYSARTFGYLVFDTLYGIGADGKAHPQMVDKDEVSSDGLTYTFTLRPGLAWHDGKPVTAADCVASLERWEPKSPLGRHLAAALESTSVVDDKTFRMKLKEPFALVREALGQPNTPVAFIMPERLVKAAGNNRIQEIVGSGPFVFKADEYRPGDRIVLEKNQRYVARSEPTDFLSGGKNVKIDRLVLRVMPDGATAVNALIAGEIDYLENPIPDLEALVAKTPSVTMIHPAGLHSYQGNIRPNDAIPPFNDPVIRQVLFRALDQSTVLEALGLPQANTKPNCRSFFMCDTPLETTEGISKVGQPSVSDARVQLARTSYKGETVVIMQPTDIEALKVAAEVTADRLTQAGFKVDLQATDWGTVASRRAKKEGWNIYPTTSSGFDLSSPLTHFAFAANCVDFPGWSCDKRLIPKMKAFSQASDEADRKRIAGEIAAIGYEDIPAIPFGQYTLAYAWRKSVKDVIPSSIPLFWQLDK